MNDEQQKRLNRIKRRLAEIEGNAKKATPGPWSISHSHVIKHDKRNGKDLSYDIASRPFERRMAVYGVYPFPSPSPYDDMRFIATCDPKKMLELVEDIRAILASTELKEALEASTELLVTVLHPGGAEQYAADIEKRVGDNRSLIGPAC